LQDPSELSLNVAGPRAWHTIEHAYQQADRIAQEAVRSIPCRSCSGEEGLMLVRGIHDVKNIELGKPVYDPQGFKHFTARVDNAAEKAGLGTGRNPIYTSSGKARSEPKMPMMNDQFAVYGGAIVEKLIDVGVKTTNGAPITTQLRNSTIGNIALAVIGAGLSYYYRNKREGVSLASAAFSAAAVNNLIDDAAAAANLPGSSGVGAVRRVSVPFVAAPQGPIISPSQAAAQSGAPALF
jgi:hypothetical protein